MSLWGSTDANTSAPKFAIFQGIGVAANGNVLFGNTQVGAFHANVGLGIDGITPAEKANVAGPQHAGWVSKKEYTGPVNGITITNVGSGYNAGNGFIAFSGGGNGSGANASYTVNAANGNSIDTVVLVSGGSDYNAQAVTANTVVAYNVQATFVVTKGGRAGRIQYETLVAGGNIA